MFNNKFFLNGLGIGIIVGAVLLQLFLVVDKPVEEKHFFPDIALDSEEALSKEVEKLGYSLVKLNKEATNTPKSTENAVTITPQPTTAPLQSSTSAPSSSAVSTPHPKTPKPTEVTPSPAASTPHKTSSPANAAATRISITIPPGSGSSQVGKLLFDKKVISDRNQFEKLLISRKLTDSIQVGTFEFTGKETLTQVIAMITS